YSQVWSEAFGIPFDPAGSTLTMVDYQALGREPQAFVAYPILKPVPADGSEPLMTALKPALINFHTEWQLGVPLYQCLDHYTEAERAGGIDVDWNNDNISDIL